MFGSIGGPEILLIFVLALLLFGPRKLPDIGRALGKTVAEFRKATSEFKSTLEREVEMERLKETGGALKSAGADTVDAVKGPGLLSEIRAALRPPAATEPYGGGSEPAWQEETRPIPDVTHPASPVGPPTTAPVPFSDESDPSPRPAAAPAADPAEHVEKHEQS
jgi:TatA/E family protein of Tat protein translocase